MGSYRTRKDMLRDVILSLKAGSPSMITLDEQDHWVVVVGATLKGGRLFISKPRPLG